MSGNANRSARPERPSGSELRGLRSREGGMVCDHRRRVPCPPSDAGGARAEPGAARASAQPEPEVAGGRAQGSNADERGFSARPRSRNPRSRQHERKEATPMSAGSARVRAAGTRGRDRTSVKSHRERHRAKNSSFTSLRSHFRGSRLQDLRRIHAARTRRSARTSAGARRGTKPGESPLPRHA